VLSVSNVQSGRERKVPETWSEMAGRQAQLSDFLQLSGGHFKPAPASKLTAYPGHGHIRLTEDELL
jgi:hypothetical protein